MYTYRWILTHCFIKWHSGGVCLDTGKEREREREEGDNETLQLSLLAATPVELLDVIIVC